MTKLVNKYKDSYDVLIGRTSKWGNPFTHITDKKTLAKFVVGSREEAISAYKKWITEGEGKHLLNDLCELKDKTLGCFCVGKPITEVRENKICHGEILLELVEKHCQ